MILVFRVRTTDRPTHHTDRQLASVYFFQSRRVISTTSCVRALSVGAAKVGPVNNLTTVIACLTLLGQLCYHLRRLHSDLFILNQNVHGRTKVYEITTSLNRRIQYAHTYPIQQTV